jgi:hypothetical protein
MKKAIVFFAAFFAANLAQAQWAPEVRLTNNNAASWLSANSNAKVLASNGDTLYAVWGDYRNGTNGEIYFKRSMDNGISWGADIQLTNNPAESIDPCILVTGTVIHVAWSDDRNGNYEIYYKRSEDGGSTWGADTRLTNALLTSNSPAMAISGSILHMVWYDERDDPSGNWKTEIYYKRSTDAGLTWGPDIRLTNDAAYSGFPGVFLTGSTVLVVWEDERDGNGEIYFKRSTDEGLTWGSDTRLTNDPANSWDPCIAVNDSVVHLVWMDDRDGSGYEVYYNRSMDGGLTWAADTRLTNALAPSEYPTVEVSGSNVHVTWQDQRNMNYEIYYKRSEDAGLTWQADTRLTNAFGSSLWPHVAVTDSTVHIIWYDKRDGNDEIYYKRNPTGNPIVGTGKDLTGNPDQQINIYPNPATTAIHINFKEYLNQPTGQAGEKTFLIIRNILGEVVLNKQIPNFETVIDVSNIQNGLYFVGINTGNKQSVSTKLIIME